MRTRGTTSGESAAPPMPFARDGSFRGFLLHGSSPASGDPGDAIAEMHPATWLYTFHPPE